MNSPYAVSAFSTLGLPGYFCGERNADTVMVHLNPGVDAAVADYMWRCETLSYRTSSVTDFIKDYVADQRVVSPAKAKIYDEFDIKQAAFFTHWPNNGIGLPVPPINWKDRDACLSARKLVLDNKLQLELVPYASASFSIVKFPKTSLMPFVETLLEEIFSKERTYVVFASAIFEDLFKFYNNNVAVVFNLTRNAVKTNLAGSTRHLRCKKIWMNYNGKHQKALIAHSFSSQAFCKAFATMEKYGKSCYQEYIN